jgi:hypothetical protein
VKGKEEREREREREREKGIESVRDCERGGKKERERERDKVKCILYKVPINNS